MNSISITYTLIWQHKEYNNYQWDDKGNCFNTHTGRRIKKVYNSGSLGYCIKGKFISVGALRNQIEKISNIVLPF